MGATSSEDNLYFKEVPDNLEEITPQWCELALKKGGIIGSKTTVTAVEVNRLVNEETGLLDGGGMTSSQMIRIKLTYDGSTEGYHQSLIFIIDNLSLLG